MVIYNNFDYTDNYSSVEFAGDERPLQSQELNEMQSRSRTDILELANSLVYGGFIKSGGYSSINGSGVVTLAAADVFINGQFYRVGASTVTITNSIAVKVGVRLVDSDIDSGEDAALLNPATGTDGYDKAGASRKKKVATWGWQDSAAATDGGSGTLYPLIYFWNRKFLAQKTDHRMPLAKVDESYNGMILFDGLIYDFNLAANMDVHVANTAFYYNENKAFGFSDVEGTIGVYDVDIIRDDATIRFNTRDIDLKISTKYLQFFLRKESTTVWNVTGVNYGI